MTPPIKIFIGSGEASLVERKVLIYSLKKHTNRPLDIYVFNGTHDTIERNDEAPIRLNMPLDIKYQNFTEFSNYRWYIPRLCGFEGRAIWMDSDMVCLSDISDFFEADMKGYGLLAKASAYGAANLQRWGLSMVLLDCQKCQFNPEQYFKEIADGLYTYTDLHQMTPQFQNYHSFDIGTIPVGWNDFDQKNENTKLIHYTSLLSQPWKAIKHPQGALWFTYFREAMETGILTKEDVEKARARYYVRPNIWEGNRPKPNSLVRRGIRKVLNRLPLNR